MICSTCGNRNAEDERYCINCGATLLPSQIPAGVGSLAASGQAPLATVAEKKDELIGRTIEGRYRIDELIGLGGMGSVYRVTRILIGDEVAMKILHTERVSDPHAGERFRREAQAAARLKHPNAVSIYDFGVTNEGLQYLVMELVEGESLRNIIKQQGTVSPIISSEITSQVCAALDEAHQHHVVHRDVKPDNIIIHSTPSRLRVKVLDFGIAKLRDDTASHLTQTGSVMGTPHYMSPEQCLGEELDNRADIYSMGVVLYEMLCGRVPFNAPISTAVVVQHVNQPPPPLRTINAKITPQLEATVLRALEKRREDRPQTAIAFAQMVAAAVRGPGVDVEREWPIVGHQSFVDKSNDDESTIEKRQPISSFELFTSSKELAPTVHLANPSGSTGSVTPVRATAGSGALSTTILKQAVAHKFVVLTLTAALLVLLIGFVSWRVFHEPEANANSSIELRPDNANVVLDNANKGKTGEVTASQQGMTFVRGGTFLMGSSDKIEDQDSKPAHSVSVKPFFIDIYEVTCADYKNFVDATRHPVPKSWVNGSYPSGAARHPVTGVSWEDANAYARWAGKRLPTEEEWEFAARGRQGLTYPWGNSWKPGCANADNEGKVRKGMADVGTYNCVSPSGAMDMIGNAWEWTASDWAPYPNGHLLEAGKGGEKVIRGGSWQSPKTVTTSFRVGLASAGEETGFRCAKDT